MSPRWRAVGTPFYCYSRATIERHYSVFADAFADVPSLVCYSLKANSNQAVIATLARLGSGADVVSEGELKRALNAGISRTRSCSPASGKPTGAGAAVETASCASMSNPKMSRPAVRDRDDEGAQRRYLGPR